MVTVESLEKNVKDAYERLRLAGIESDKARKAVDAAEAAYHNR